MHQTSHKTGSGIFPVAFFFMTTIFPLAGFTQSAAPADSLNQQIFQVIRSGKADRLNDLLSAGANPNTADHGMTALMAGALNGTKEQMELLISRGAAVNAIDSDGITALWYSVPDYDKINLLLQHGADPRLHSKEGYTVLAKLANYPGTSNIFRLLMAHGANPRNSEPDNTLLYNAASSGDTALASMLLKNGLNINDTVALGDYPINSALNFRCFAMVKMLVDRGADVNRTPMHFPLDLINGITPLMFAAVSNDSLSFFYLLDHGADPGAKSKRGYTVLMYVQQAEKEEPAMTRALLDRGADPLVKAPDGTDALSLARLKGNTQTFGMLKEYTHK